MAPHLSSVHVLFSILFSSSLPHSVSSASTWSNLFLFRISFCIFSLSLSLTFSLLFISPILVYPSSSFLRTIRFSLSLSFHSTFFSFSFTLATLALTGKTAKILTTGNLCGRQRMRADTCTHVNTHRETDMRAPIIYTIITHGHTHTRKHADVHT